MENKTIRIDELKSKLERAEDFVLIDVLPPEAYAEKHIPGSVRATVYEVTFLDQVKELVPDFKKEIVVYGTGENSDESAVAQEKLLRAGYGNVWNFSSGLSGWEEAGNPIETGDGNVMGGFVVEDGRYEIDLDKSSLEWIGRGVGAKHVGEVKIESGELVILDGKITEGKFQVDMKSIHDLDLKDNILRGVLERHLNSEDFFETEKYPKASFKILSSSCEMGDLGESLACQIGGALEIKDVVREIEIDALVLATGKGRIKAGTDFEIDRTLWNVKYGSNKFFRKLGTHLVKNEIGLDVRLEMVKID